MALANAVQAARHTTQRITWADADGDPLNLTGATITARLLDLATGQARAATGALEVLDADAGYSRGRMARRMWLRPGRLTSSSWPHLARLTTRRWPNCGRLNRRYDARGSRHYPTRGRCGAVV